MPTILRMIQPLIVAICAGLVASFPLPVQQALAQFANADLEPGANDRIGALVVGEGWQSRNWIGQPNPDGRLDTTFNPMARETEGVYDLYLPVVTNHWPPIPAIPLLNPINNPEGGGNYIVSWSAADMADTYVLQEDSNPNFSNPMERFSGLGTSWNATGISPGTYYYRVKASNAWGDSNWSNVHEVTVIPPTSEVYVKNDTGGALCYEVFDSNIGQHCYPLGIHFYGSFPSGTYSYRASAWCGSISESRDYDPGELEHEFRCE
jgi:hypothetical protein